MKRKEVKENAGYFPVWNEERPNEIEVRSRGETNDVRRIKVYCPKYFPNPLTQYVRSCI